METTILLSEVVSALSMALDLTEGQPMGHAIRSCVLGMRMGQELGLDRQQLSDLYYALLLKDSGCSSNSARMHQILGSDDLQAKREVKLEDWTRPSLSGLRYLNRNTVPGASPWNRLKKMVGVGLAQKRNNLEMISARCERGAEIARKIGFSEATSEAIHALDEHWNGGGYPERLSGDEIPVLARIINVSQTLEVFASAFGAHAALQVVAHRSGTWFDPEVVRIAATLEVDVKLWQTLPDAGSRYSVLPLDPGGRMPASPARIDSICQAFADIVDAKSPFTFQHSVGVAHNAVLIAEELGLGAPKITTIRRAALLHDIGKLGVSNAILDKPDKLTDEEWQAMKMHPLYTRQILEVITGFEEIAEVAGAHHEKLDGSGYPNRMTGTHISLLQRLVVVADVFQALSERRPYRDAIPPETVLTMMAADVPHKLDAECFQALRRRTQSFNGIQTKTFTQAAGR